MELCYEDVIKCKFARSIKLFFQESEPLIISPQIYRDTLKLPLDGEKFLHSIGEITRLDNARLR